MVSLRSTEDAACPLRNLEGEASYAPRKRRVTSDELGCQVRAEVQRHHALLLMADRTMESMLSLPAS